MLKQRSQQVSQIAVTESLAVGHYEARSDITSVHVMSV